MSDRPGPDLPQALREQTLARFEAHRRTWNANPALRMSYAGWYHRLRQAMPAQALGPWIELGSGPGFARDFIPELLLTDVVQAPWHDRSMSADVLAFEDGSVGALVLFDVLHHLASPAAFFTEATRVLRPGGRILLCEPYIGPLSRWIYGCFHEEPVDMSVDPLVDIVGPVDGAKDPFASNQATPTLAFCRDRGRKFSRMFPRLGVLSIECMAGPSYVATGGFSRRPLLPWWLWRSLYAFEGLLPKFVFRLLGFRLLVVIERRR
jgi:SAM-dependent methyltransferase